VAFNNTCGWLCAKQFLEHDEAEKQICIENPRRKSALKPGIMVSFRPRLRWLDAGEGITAAEGGRVSPGDPEDGTPTLILVTVAKGRPNGLRYC